MQTVDVDQAIFASSSRGMIRGYQLVSWSPGIDRRCEQTLCRWSPTQLPSETPGGWTINYFPISDAEVAIARTLPGGPEYSGRGAAEVITRILVLREEVFAAYACHGLAVAQTAMAMGLLKLPLDERMYSQLPTAALPRFPLVDPLAATQPKCPRWLEGLIGELANRIVAAQRVAVIGLRDPLEALRWLLPKLPETTRRNFSFTSGLLPSSHRPFQGHFLHSADAATRQRLRSQGIHCIDHAEPPALQPNGD